MSKSQPKVDLKEFVAKRLNVGASKLEIFDEYGNKFGITPIFSPTLSLLLCAVHKQKIFDVKELPDEIAFTTFETNSIVSKANELWRHVTKEYKSGDTLNLEHCILHYLRHFAGEENLKKVDKAMDIIMEIRKKQEASA